MLIEINDDLPIIRVARALAAEGLTLRATEDGRARIEAMFLDDVRRDLIRDDQDAAAEMAREEL